MNNRCLYCYGALNGESDYHEKCTLEFFGTRQAPVIDYSLNQMTELAKHVVERSVSVPGVQAKLSMTLISETKKRSNTRLTVVGVPGGNYIFKPPTEYYPEMPQNEHLTMRMAEAFGIRVVPSSLIRLKSGELSYITRRIDRRGDGTKIHMIDMFQILEAFDKYIGSMERIGKALGDYSSNPLLDKILFFDLTLFSFLTGNSDMHLKNFSMIESPSGWVLSSAYDLLNVVIINPKDTEEMALTIGGKKKKLSRSIFDRFGQKMGLSEAQTKGAYKRIERNIPKALDLLERSYLSEEMKKSYLKVLETRSRILAP